jgi:MoaA/NifB/PqqE/SkfB family radical SAM enzyme
MANVLLTTACNLACEYCFARERMLGKPRQHMSMQDVRKVLAFLKHSGSPVFRMMGGEPTLHPDFHAIVQFVLQEGMRIDLLSNATWDASCNELFARISPNRLIFLLNIDHPDNYSPKLWSRIERNLAALADDKRITLSFNIFEKQPRSDYVLDLASRFNIGAIRMSFSLPVFGAQNKHLELRDYPEMASFIVDFVRRAEANQVSVQLDNAVPLCIFSHEQIGELVLKGTLDLARNARCRPVVDIGPDLTVWCCFCLSQLFNRHLDEFKDLAEIEAYYQKILNSYQGRIFAMDACYECRYRVLWGCQGGCLTYALVRHGTGPASELPQEGMQIDWQEQAALVLSDGATLRHYDLPRESYVLKDQESGTEVELDASLGPLWSLLDGKHTARQVVHESVDQCDGRGMRGPVDAFMRHVMAESLSDLLLGLMRQGLISQRSVAEPSSSVGKCPTI